MSLPLSEPEVFALYSMASRQKISRYLGRQNLSFEMTSNHGLVRTEVQGSETYVVYFNPDSAESLADFRCTCPASQLCVHKAVAWISWLAAGNDSTKVANSFLAQGLSTPPKASPLAPDASLSNPLAEDDPEERGIDTGLHHEASQGSAVIATLAKALGILPLEPTNNTKEQWKPLICLAPAEAGWMVKLALVHVKKDRSEGRLKDWRPGQQNVSASAADSAWVDILTSHGGAVDLDRFYLMAMASPELPAPELRSALGQPLITYEISSVTQIYEPHIESWGPQHLHWRGRLEVTDHEGSIHRVQHFQAGSKSLFFILEDSGLGICPGEPRLAALLKLSTSSLSQFGHEELDTLESLVRANAPAHFELSIRGRNCSQVLTRGDARIELSLDKGIWGKGPHLTILHFSVAWDIFKTDGSKAPTDEDWLRTMELDGNGAILHERDLDWEGRVLAWLETELADQLDRLDDNDGAFYRKTNHRTASGLGSYRAIPPPGPRGKLRQLDQGRDLYWRGTPEAFLATWGEKLMEAGFSLALEAGAPPSVKGSVTIRIDQGLDWLDLEPAVDIKAPSTAPGSRKRAARKARQPDPQRRSELVAVQDLLQHRFLSDNNGRLILLSPEDTDKLARLLDTGVALSGRTRLSKKNITALAALPEEETATIPAVQTARKLIDSLSKLDDTLLIDPAPGFVGRLRGYQRHGYSWLYHHVQAGLGACLADDMGLGKTVQTLALIQKLYHEHQDPRPFRVILVVPVSTQANWEAECARFTPNLGIGLHAGAKRPSNDHDLEAALKTRHITLISYATLRADIELFAPIECTLLVLDEAQQIKNPESQVFKAVKSIKASTRISLTGTPIENSVFDLWSQFEFLNPGMLGTLKRFRSRFAFGIEERTDPKALADLRRITRPFVLRRRKNEVATELPPREETVIYCDLGPEQRRIYQDILDACRLRVDEAIRKNGISRAGITILESLLRLRQACLFPGLINEAWANCPSTKLEVFTDLALELAAEDHKALVFSQFTGVLDKLEKELIRLKLSSVRLDGQSTQRGKLISTFNTDPDCRLFLLSLKAGGVGINLASADYVVLFDPWWNPAAEAQAIDRAHRIGQTRSVFVYRLVVRDTVEEKILKLQDRKRELATSLLDQSDEVLAKTSPEELLALLG